MRALAKIPDRNKGLFEKYFPLIEQEISKKQVKWNLTAIPSLSFEDIAQILRTHIYKKIHLYDPKKSPIEPWLSTVISHQLKNIWRNLYINYNKPCISCACSEGETGCRIYGEQDEECPLYKHWLKAKLSAYNTRLPVSIENHEQEVYELPHKNINIELTAEDLHDKMKGVLTFIEFKVYNFLYIQNKNEEDLITNMMEKNGKSKQNSIAIISKIKKTIKEKAKELIANDQIDIIEN